MKYAVVATVEGRFVVEVGATDKVEANEKVRRFIESQGLTVMNLDESLSIRTVK